MTHRRTRQVGQFRSLCVAFSLAASGCLGAEPLPDEAEEAELGSAKEALTCSANDIRCRLTAASGGMLDQRNVNLEDDGQFCDGLSASAWAPNLAALPETYGDYVHRQVQSVFPGAMYAGATMVTGRVDGPIFDQQNTGGVLTLSGIKLGNTTSPSLNLARFDKASVDAGIQTILANTQAQLLPSTFQEFSEIERLHESTSKWNVSLKFLIKSFNLSADASQTKVNRQYRHDRVLRLTQEFYTATVNDPNLGTFLTITGADLDEKRIRTGNSLTEVRRVNYGRDLFARIYSNSTSNSVQTTFNLALKLAKELKIKGQGVKVEVDLGLGISQSQLDELRTTNVQAWEVGGSAASLPMSADEFIESIVNDDVLGGEDNFNPVPLAYSLHEIVTQRPVRASRTTDFTLEICNPWGASTFQFNLDKVTFLQNGDRSGKSNTRGKVTISGGGTSSSATISKSRRADGDSVSVSGAELRLYNLPLDQPSDVTITVEAEEEHNARWRGISEPVHWHFSPAYEAATAPLAGLWTSARHGENIANPGDIVSAYVGNNDRDDLYLKLDYKVVQDDGSKCVPGTFWTGRGCVARRFLLNNQEMAMFTETSAQGLGSLEYEQCVADDLFIGAHSLYATRQRLAPYRNTYSFVLSEVDASHRVLAVHAEEAKTISTSNGEAGGLFTLKSWVESRGKVLEPNKIYRISSDWTPLKYWYVRTKPQGVEFTIDDKVGDYLESMPNVGLPRAIFVGANDAMSLRPSVCSGRSTFDIRVDRTAANGRLEEVFSLFELSKTNAADFDLRDALMQRGALEPNATYTVTIRSGGQTQVKTLHVAPCSTGTAWTGAQCSLATLHRIQRQGTSECVAAAPSQVAGEPALAVPAACTADGVGFYFVNMSGGLGQLRSVSEERCLERGNFGDLTFAPCRDIPTQLFESIDYGAYMQLRQPDVNRCLTFNGPFVGEVGMGSCATTDSFNHLMRLTYAVSGSDFLVAHYRGSDNLDSHGSAHGTFHADAGVSPEGRCGSALRFAGTGASLGVGATALFPHYDDFTISLWMKSRTGGPLVTQTSDVERDLSLVVNQSGVEFGMYVGNPASPTGAVHAIAPVSVLDDQWHHVVVSVDRDDPLGSRIYVDGTLRRTFNATSQRGDLRDVSTDIGGFRPVWNGTVDEGYASLPGLIDDVKFYRRALPIELIATSCDD